MRDAAFDLLSKAQALVDSAQARLEASGADGCETCGRGSDDDHALLAKTVKDASQVVGRVKDVARLVGQFSGELRERDEIDLREAKGWDRFVMSIGKAVHDCENCSERVAAALEKLDEA
ncbi:MAG: hypothetical protein U0441_14845 [Polyangiaceae bacterium]